MDTEQQSATSLVTDAIIIASFTALAYLFSFTYEAGFCGFFHIPLDFISLSLTTILVAVGALLVIITSVILIINSLSMAGLFDFRDPIKVAFSRSVVVLLFLAAHILLFGKQWREWIWILAVLGIVVIFDFILPLIDQRGKGSYKDKITAQIEAREKSKSLALLITTRFGNIGITVFFIIVLGLNFTYNAGKAHAEHQEEFLIIDQSPEVVVLRVYGDFLFTAPLNRSAKQIDKKFLIIKLSDSSPTSVALEKVGPLTVKP